MSQKTVTLVLTTLRTSDSELFCHLFSPSWH